MNIPIKINDKKVEQILQKLVSLFYDKQQFLSKRTFTNMKEMSFNLDQVKYQQKLIANEKQGFQNRPNNKCMSRKEAPQNQIMGRNFNIKTAPLYLQENFSRHLNSFQKITRHFNIIQESQKNQNQKDNNYYYFDERSKQVLDSMREYHCTRKERIWQQQNANEKRMKRPFDHSVSQSLNSQSFENSRILQAKITNDSKSEEIQSSFHQQISQFSSAVDFSVESIELMSRKMEEIQTIIKKELTKQNKTRMKEEVEQNKITEDIKQREQLKDYKEILHQGLVIKEEVDQENLGYQEQEIREEIANEQEALVFGPLDIADMSTVGSLNNPIQPEVVLQYIDIIEPNVSEASASMNLQPMLDEMSEEMRLDKVSHYLFQITQYLDPKGLTTVLDYSQRQQLWALMHLFFKQKLVNDQFLHILIDFIKMYRQSTYTRQQFFTMEYMFITRKIQELKEVIPQRQEQFRRIRQSLRRYDQTEIRDQL